MLSDFSAAAGAELRKLRRALLPRVTLLVILLAGAVNTLFMFILVDPTRAHRFGMLGTKAELSGVTPDWAGAYALAAQIAGVGGLVLFGVVAVWVFGREFADGTAKDLLSLPVTRRSVVLGKIVVSVGWSMFLVLVLAAGTGVGAWALGLPGRAGAVWSGIGLVLAVGGLTVALTASFALAASVGRGYLAAFGAVFGSLVLAQVVAALGYGAWFPWAVPGLLAVSDGSTPPAVGSLLGVLAVLVVSVVATVVWWERADHAR